MNNKQKNIPKHWKWVTLDDIGIVVSGGTPSTKEPEFWNGDISWVTPADLSNHDEVYISKGSRNISQVGLEYSSAYLLPANSIVFSSRAPIGYVAITKNELATNQGFKNLILPSELVNPKYVYYYLKAVKELAENMASGTTFLELSATKFRQIPFPLAPIEEQNSIVEKIEELLSQIENSEKNILNSLKSLEKLSFLTSNKFFIKDKNTKLKKIKNIGVVTTGKTPNTNNRELYSGKINFFRPSDIGLDLNLFRSETKISEKGWLNSPQAEINSILVTCIGTIGKVGIVKQAGGFNQQINKITVGKEYIPEYVLYFCLSQFFQNQLLENSSSTTISIINKTKFENLEIFDIDITNQRKIVDFLNETQGDLKSQEQHIRIELEKIKSLKSKILGQAFNGKLINEISNSEVVTDLIKNINIKKKEYFDTNLGKNKKTKISSKKNKKDLLDILMNQFNKNSFLFDDIMQINTMAIDLLEKEFNSLLIDGKISKIYDKKSKSIKFKIS